MTHSSEPSAIPSGQCDRPTSWAQRFQQTVERVRDRLEVDRMALYRFAGDGSGEIVAEARQANVLPSLHGYCFPRESIPTRAREAYLRHGQQVIIDLDSERKTLAQWPIQPGSSEQRYEWVDPCHLHYLRAMGVRASLTVPVIYQDALWGLLAVHHSQSATLPRLSCKPCNCRWASCWLPSPPPIATNARNGGSARPRLPGRSRSYYRPMTRAPCPVRRCWQPARAGWMWMAPDSI
ncbi:MAG: hypothetical protein BRC58_08650 [Cyanobacteria bacterium QS_8_64_29]|nr:MAG: hypothetical protein BRC58_08650 [Cyanobacteria bacterium QS_8_64_29]